MEASQYNYHAVTARNQKNLSNLQIALLQNAQNWCTLDFARDPAPSSKTF